MVLKDASASWSHACLLSTNNLAFARLPTQIIQTGAPFPDYAIMIICLHNADEFTSQSFYDYCMSVEIIVEQLVVHVYTENGLVESFIKCLQLELSTRPSESEDCMFGPKIRVELYISRAF